MFFLTRSALCIGLVAFMLPGAGTTTMADLAADTQAVAGEGLRHYCRAAEDCAETGTRIAGWLLAGPTGPSKGAVPVHRFTPSVTTLGAADLVPPWRGPSGRVRG